MQKVVITGGTGFIGSWLVEEMLEQSIEVIMLVREAAQCSVTDREGVNVVVYYSEEYERLKEQKEPIDAFYHLGWGGVATQDKNDCRLQMNNISFSMEMLDYAYEIGAAKFIGIGTVAEYSFCESIMDVNAKQTPNDMYGAAKTAVHYLLETRARLLKMQFIWTVLPSTFGEGRRDNNIITYTILSLLRGDIPEYGYLTQMWDFLYVKEVVRALRYIGERGFAGKTYAIGSGVFKPLKDYIITIRDIINPNQELGIGVKPELSDKVFSSCVSIYDLTKDTGFIPEISFEEGIRKTIEYYRNLQY
ncbi:MAG: NAD-dependent epimerase/dehydratase family protein [Lachnospiraceae bacterium]|nr:NAD-dependent epimerase/dehydratase family protein [Lachnospiraceae bacterium]